jgi:carbonic anhydrase
VIEPVEVNSPQRAWDALMAGNQRFVNAQPAHQRQDIDRRESLSKQQAPFAALFGCSDSRLSAEIIFDVGLGDLFVVRNAGQVLAETIIGSLEYAVEILKVPLILVLGHDECGAIRASIDAVEGKSSYRGAYIHNLVDRIMPTVLAGNLAGKHKIDEITLLHVEDTINELVSRSELISEAIRDGKLAIAGANYTLTQGEVHQSVIVGSIK